MKLLGLPGRRADTLAQMQAIIGALQVGQTSAEVQCYGFWGPGDTVNPDIAPEAERAAGSGASAVVAKSIGTLVTMAAETGHGFAPDWCVFVGTPLRRLETLGLTPMLIAHCQSRRTLMIQQTDDFNGPFADLAALVSGCAGAECVEVAGEDHAYSNLEEIVAAVHAWRASH